jgi:hypothetical protein
MPAVWHTGQTIRSSSDLQFTEEWALDDARIRFLFVLESWTRTVHHQARGVSKTVCRLQRGMRKAS